MNFFNSRLLKNALEPLRQSQRHLDRVYDYYVREARSRNKPIDEVLDFAKENLD